MPATLPGLPFKARPSIFLETLKTIGKMHTGEMSAEDGETDDDFEDDFEDDFDSDDDDD
jgi:hypothetical protein